MMRAQPAHSYSSYLSNVRSLRHRATNISELAQLAMRLADDGYYDQMKALILRPWRFAEEFGLVAVDPDLRWAVDRDKTNTG